MMDNWRRYQLVRLGRLYVEHSGYSEIAAYFLENGEHVHPLLATREDELGVNN